MWEVILKTDTSECGGSLDSLIVFGVAMMAEAFY